MAEVLEGGDFVGDYEFVCFDLAVGFFFGDDVDSNVSGFALARPFVEHPDVGEALGIEGVEFEVATNEALEAVAKVAVVERVFAELGEDVVNGGHVLPELKRRMVEGGMRKGRTDRVRVFDGGRGAGCRSGLPVRGCKI